MDTLDKIEDTLSATQTYGESDANLQNGMNAVNDVVDDAVTEVTAVSRKIDWLAVAGYAAVAAAGALAGYAYGKGQPKPKTRLERLRDQLGLEPVDLSRLPASLRDIDFNRVKRTGYDVGAYAKKATHAGAKKVAELTR